MEQICILFYNLFKKQISFGLALQTLQPIIINNAKQKLICRSLPCKPENSVDLIKIEGKKTKFTL